MAALVGGSSICRQQVHIPKPGGGKWRFAAPGGGVVAFPAFGGRERSLMFRPAAATNRLEVWTLPPLLE